jgi:stalled ribosome alternative rescue factor ArfA
VPHSQAEGQGKGQVALGKGSYVRFAVHVTRNSYKNAAALIITGFSTSMFCVLPWARLV